MVPGPENKHRVGFVNGFKKLTLADGSGTARLP